MKIILASGSPRRRELMDRIGAVYEVMPSDKDEDMSCKDPETLVKGLAKMKAEDICDKLAGKPDYSDCVIIGADTVVAHKGSIMGKPADRAMAYEMISSIAGDSHHVYTGVCLLIVRSGQLDKLINYSVATEVKVCPITEAEINAYIDTPEPYDKAGGYAIQGLFAPYIEGLNGDYYNIVGFPISSIYHRLLEQNIDLRKK